MIKVEYFRENNRTVVSVDGFITDKSIFPLKVEFINIITKELHYYETLSPSMWASWIGAELLTDVYVYTNSGELLYKWEWDVVEHGDPIEKILWYYLYDKKLKNIETKGLVIGSHDGRNGHWVYPVNKGITTATLIDGSDEQFQKLTENYLGLSNVKLVNTIVTKDGSEVVWFKGGEGYTDTVKIDLIRQYVTDNEITHDSRPSISINDLMENQNYDWVHLDVEGLDAELILNMNQRPNVIIYESMNLTEDENSKLDDWFKNNSYEIMESQGNTVAIKRD